MIDLLTLMDHLHDILTGVIVKWPGPWNGRGQLVAADEPRVKELHEIPGVGTFDLKGFQGTVIPHNLWLMGKRPGTLYEYEPDLTPTTPSGLALKDYQRRSVTFLRRVCKDTAGAILGSAPGLGKTITSLQALWLDGYLQRRGLVLGPLAARGTWCGPGTDPWEHYSLDIKPLEGTDAHPSHLEGHSWFFIHYDVLPAWQSLLFSELKPAAVVFDECHALKNSEGKHYSAALTVAARSTIERRYGLTGTPIPKSRMDLYGQLAILQPNQWGNNKFPFGIRYLGGRRELTPGATDEGRSYWVFDAQTNTDELRARLAGVYLRYNKADVPNELPKLHRQRIEVELPPDARKDYYKARNDIRSWLRSQGKLVDTELQIAGVSVELKAGKLHAPQLVMTSALKSILDRGKLPQATAVIAELMQKHARLVVFVWRRESAKYLCKQLRAVDGLPQVYGPIDGTDAWSKRKEVALAFAESPRGIFVATRGSVAIAINDLKAADACLQVTPDWNPDGNIQAESRLHREGAWAKEVFSYYMLAKGTLDDHILELIQAKGEQAAAVTPEDCEGMHLAADLTVASAEEALTPEEIGRLMAEVEDLL